MGETIRAKMHPKIGTIANLSITGADDLARLVSRECMEVWILASVLESPKRSLRWVEQGGDKEYHKTLTSSLPSSKQVRRRTVDPVLIKDSEEPPLLPIGRPVMAVLSDSR